MVHPVLAIARRLLAAHHEEVGVAAANNEQIQEATFLTGITLQGKVAPTSYWTWDHSLSESYSTRHSYEAKWGTPSAGTGASVNIAFDTASNWTATEQSAFTAAMHLWSAEANIRFNLVAPAYADVTISRSSDGSATGGITSLDTRDIGSARLGTAFEGAIDIDTSV